MHSEKSPSGSFDPAKPPAVSRRRSRTPFIALCVAAVVVLALALGLGLGLGLKHHSSSSSGSSGNGGGGGGGNSTTPPPPSQNPSLNTSMAAMSNFLLPNISGDPPMTRKYTFVLQEMSGAPDGVSRPMLVINGTYPGPTIQANQLDRVEITVLNSLQDNSTAIHWHGLFQNGTNYYDGTNGITQCGIPAGSSLTYNFTFGDWSGTTWWHAHYSTQYTDGVSGALIVNPAANSTLGANGTTIPVSAPPTKPVVYDQDVVVHMADWYHTPSGALLAQYLSPGGMLGDQYNDNTFGDEPVPDSGTINGLGQWGDGGDFFNFTLDANKTYRFRLINAGSLGAVRFSIDSHPLTVISADGVDVQPLEVAGVVIAIAQRYDVLVTTNRTESEAWWVRATLQSDMFTYDEPNQNIDIRAVLRYGAGLSNSSLPANGNATSDDPGPGVPGLPDLDTGLLVPAEPIEAPQSTRTYPVTASFQKTQNGPYLAFMNDTSWSPLVGASTLTLLLANNGSVATTFLPDGVGIYQSSQLVVTEDSIQTVDLIVNNLDDGDHPFHLHGHRPWIMAYGDGRYVSGAVTFNTTNPMRRDTHLIPAYSYAVLRFVTDNPGFWAFHCHIAWHMSAGLMMQISSLPSRMAQFTLPADIVSQCASDKGSIARRQLSLPPA